MVCSSKGVFFDLDFNLNLSIKKGSSGSNTTKSAGLPSLILPNGAPIKLAGFKDKNLNKVGKLKILSLVNLKAEQRIVSSPMAPGAAVSYGSLLLSSS